MLKIIQSLLIILLITAAGAGVYLYWQHRVRYPSTDDAYVQANVIHVATRVNGSVLSVKTQNHQYVRKGTVLFTLDSKPFQIALQKAKANLDETIQKVNATESSINTAHSLLIEREAELANAKKDAERTLTLVKKNLASQSAGDRVTRQLKVAEASVQAAQSQLEEAKQHLGNHGAHNASIRAAKAALTQAELNLSYTTVIAPHDGYVANLHLRVGDKVTAYQNLFALIESRAWWVNGNFKETQLKRIHPGQTATVVVDMYPQHTFQGTVISISHGSGTAFALLPPENATGNWIKVTQRIPVRVRINAPEKAFPLRLGASATVTIDTTRHD